MSQSSHWMRGMVLAAIVLCIVFSVRASGTPDKGALVMGVVDFGKVEKQYKLKATVESDLKVMQNRLMGNLSRRNDLPLLTEAEQTELDKLYEKKAAGPLSDAETKRIDEITNKGNQLSAEIRQLQQKDQKDLTDADKKKLRDAEAEFGKAQQILATKKDESDNLLKQFLAEKSEMLDNNVKAAVTKVAEQKGVTIVFSSQVVPYAGTDLTTQVVTELNKK